jgi:Ran GTPase-activating protein (RanGAP) involved in mRNA processing and transport
MPENEAVIEKQYEMLWRNKWLTANATSLDEMIDHLQQAVDELRAMRAAGVTLSEDSAMPDDYAELVTADPKVAEKFGFQEVDCGDEEGFWEDDSDAEEAKAAKSKKAKQAKAKQAKK